MRDSGSRSKKKATMDQEVTVSMRVKGELRIIVPLAVGETDDDARRKANARYDEDGAESGDLEWETTGDGEVGIIE